MSYEAWGEPPDQPELPDGWWDEDQVAEAQATIERLTQELQALRAEKEQFERLANEAEAKCAVMAEVLEELVFCSSNEGYPMAHKPLQTAREKAERVLSNLPQSVTKLRAVVETAKKVTEIGPWDDDSLGDLEQAVRAYEETRK